MWLATPSGHSTDHQPLCRAGPRLLRWFEQNLEKVLPQPPKTSQVSGGKGGSQKLTTREGFWGPRKGLSTLAVYPHLFPGTHRAGAPLPGRSLMGRVTARETGGSGGGRDRAQLARGGIHRACFAPCPHSLFIIQGSRDEPADDASVPGTERGPGKGLSGMVTG